MFVKNIESRRFRSLFLSLWFFERAALSIELDRMERLRMRKKERNQKYKMKQIKIVFHNEPSIAEHSHASNPICLFFSFRFESIFRKLFFSLFRFVASAKDKIQRDFFIIELQIQRKFE